MTQIKYRNNQDKEFWLNTTIDRMKQQGQLYPDCHKPTHAELIEYGYSRMVEKEYDPATQKRLPNSIGNWVVDGEDTYLRIVELTTEELEVKADAKLNRLLSEVDTLAIEKVSLHIDLAEKAHWMGVADALARKHNLWLGENLVAGQESRDPDMVTFPPLTVSENQLWSNLSVIQKLTAQVRDAATAIATELYQMTTTEITALPDGWVASHILWP